MQILRVAGARGLPQRLDKRQRVCTCVCVHTHRSLFPPGARSCPGGTEKCWRHEFFPVGLPTPSKLHFWSTSSASSLHWWLRLSPLQITVALSLAEYSSFPSSPAHYAQTLAVSLAQRLVLVKKIKRDKADRKIFDLLLCWLLLAVLFSAAVTPSL